MNPRAVISLVLGSVFLYPQSASLLASTQDADHFYVCGPLDKLLAEGAIAAPVTKGLGASLTVLPSGQAEPSTFTFKGPKWKSEATLSLENLKVADGALSGTAVLKNKSGSSIQGVRLDLVSANEEYTEKDANGTVQTKTRMQNATCVPLYFGDLLNSESSDAVSLSVVQLKFSPETTKITLNFVISGMYYLGSFTDPEKDLYAEGVTFTPNGKLIVAGGQREHYFIFDADGKNGKKFGPPMSEHWPLHLSASATEWYCVATNDKGVRRMSFDGSQAAIIPGGEEGFGAWCGPARVDRSGVLWASVHDSLVQLVNGKAGKKVYEGQFGLYTPFDFDAQNNVWYVNDEGLARGSSDGKHAVLIKRGSARCGGIMSMALNRSLRVDPANQIYLGDQPDPESPEKPRVSIFDSRGRFVRWFGHAGRTKKPDELGEHDGQIRYKTNDFAFHNGVVYVANGDPERAILMYEPF